ncbi:MAG: response regulator [Candidatus Latescibacterota bacterium]|jgi:two-component system phosphate regulon response regulator PhoB|nr:MAG: response regulator [Candidatus Latescibacterota bacterium]
MSAEHILVVDDEEDILELVSYNLVKAGYRVTKAASGEEAIKSARAKPPDLVLLDLMLPGVDGFEVCNTLKRDPRTANVPVVMLTARGEEPDIVAGLELGADDYITKPFSPRVMIARIRAVLRRKTKAPAEESAVIKLKDLVIHPGRHEVAARGKKIDLTSTEFRVLHLLARRPGWVFTRQQIIDAARGDEYPVTDRSVDVHIVGLRKKLGALGERIETVRGVGYRYRES